MKKIAVFIETGLDGTYNAYLKDEALPFGAIGEGKTIAEAKQDFLNVVNSYKEEWGDVLANVQFDFRYDMPSARQSGKRLSATRVTA